MKKKFMLLVLSVLSVLAAAIALVACGGIKYSGPDNIAYDGQYITWDKVSTPIVGDTLGKSADYYNVSINGGEKQRSNSTTYAYTSSETFEVTIAAVFDGEEKTSASVTFKPLAPIEEVSVADDGAVFWNAVPGATAYSLTVNGQAATTTDTRYELPAGSNRVKVKPIVTGDPTYYSSWSKEVSATVFNAPTNIRYDGTTLSWTGNASEYLVTVSGENSMQETVRGNSCQFNSGNKDFTVEVKAVGNHTSTYDSKSATEEYHYLDPVTDLTVEDGILKWTAIANAEGYKIKINNVEKDTVIEPEYDKIVAGKSQDICVMPVNNSGNYFSSWSGVKTVYLLEAPVLRWEDMAELDGKEGKNLYWDPIGLADGYTVRLTKDGVSQETIKADECGFLHAYKDVGVYTVEVKSNAEDGNTNYQYDSRYSEPITIERLAAPKMADNNFITSDADHLNAGFTINFIKVEGASKYQLYRDNAELMTTTGSSFVVGNVVDASSDPLAKQEIKYKIRSIGGQKTVSGRKYITLSSLTEDSLPVDITVQAAPSKLKMEGFMLSWDGSGANEYTIFCAGKPFMAPRTEYDLEILKADTYEVSVCARGNGREILASSCSTPIKIERLKKPENISITSSGNGTLFIDDIDLHVEENAKAYQVFLNGSDIELDRNAFASMYDYITTSGTDVNVTALANYYDDSNGTYIMSSERSDTHTFTRLAKPTFPEGALLDGTTLTWNSSNLVGWSPEYMVLCDGIEERGTVRGNSYNISELEGGKDHIFKVKAKGDDVRYLDSEFSDDFEVFKLATPTFRIEEDKYVWDGVERASSYSLMIDGVDQSNEIAAAGKKYSYKPSFTLSSHTVTLRAIGDGRNTLNSEVFSRDQETAQLQLPEISYKYSHTEVTKGGFIEVRITKPSPLAKSYKYMIAGVSTTSTDLVYKKPSETPGRYNISVCALGGTFDENGVYYVDSNFTNEGEIVLLGTPNSANLILAGNSVKWDWDNVSGAYGYDYQISYNGENFGEEIKHTSNSEILDPIENFKTYRSITIRVRATGGNAGKTVSSKWIEFTWTNSSL